MKRKKPIKKQPTPKGIKFEEKDGEYRLYKIWAGNTINKEPFLITDAIDDAVESYAKYCKQWNIKPDMKLVYNLIDSNNKKAEQDESNFLKSGIF